MPTGWTTVKHDLGRPWAHAGQGDPRWPAHRAVRGALRTGRCVVPYTQGCTCWWCLAHRAVRVGGALHQAVLVLPLNTAERSPVPLQPPLRRAPMCACVTLQVHGRM